MFVKYKNFPVVNLDNVTSYYLTTGNANAETSIKFHTIAGTVTWLFGDREDSDICAKEIYDRLLTTTTNVREMEYMP